MLPPNRPISAGSPSKLLESGPISLAEGREPPVVVVRGMSIVSRDGLEVGKIAAVVLDSSQTVTHVLLCRLPRRRPTGWRP